ncbi:MAG: MFS transporter [Promethearchaeota archaeon]
MYQQTKKKGKTSLEKADILGIILFLPLVLLASSDSALLSGNQVLIMADLQMNVIFFDILVGASILINGIFTFVFGYLSDKHARKKLLIIGGLLWALNTFFVSFTPDGLVAYLFIFKLMATVGQGAITPVVFSLLSDMFPSEKRANSFAWWGIATMVGGLAGGTIALLFNRIDFESITNWERWDLMEKMHYLQQNFPNEILLWRMPFMLTGILGLIFTGLCFLVKEPKRGARDKELRDALANENLQYSYKIKKSDLKYIFTRRSNFWLIFNFLDVVVSGFFIANILLYIQVEMQFTVKLSLDNISSLGKILVMLVPAVFLGIFGQFYMSNLGDRKVKKGDPAGRVKIAILCGIMHIPFFVLAFLFTPFNGTPPSFFFGKLLVPDWGFWLLMLLMGLTLGTGLFFSLGIAPNWYSSLIDVNLPEHRGTMIATASFLDTIGRSFGSIAGGLFIAYFNQTTHYSISMSIIVMTVTFGSISGLMWVPIYYYCNQDFAYVKSILDKRGEELKRQIQ